MSLTDDYERWTASHKRSAETATSAMRRAKGSHEHFRRLAESTLDREERALYAYLRDAYLDASEALRDALTAHGQAIGLFAARLEEDAA